MQYINTAYIQVVNTANYLAETIEQVKLKAAAEKEVKNAPLDSQESELAQNTTPDPTGKVNMNLVNRCASLLDEDDADEWDDAYLRPDIVNQDKAHVVITCLLVENGEWVYLLGQDRQ